METNKFENGNSKYVPALFSTDPAAIAAAETAKARIQAAYVMALQKPRNEDEARDRILHACKRSAFAERVEFNKPVAGKQIKGPSIRFAELALREWENILTETQVVYEDDHIRRVKVFVTDLETNRIASKEIQVGKTVERKNAKDREVISQRLNSKNEVVYIVKATEDELQNKENALISKAIRNEGLRLIPSDVTDEAIETARQTLQSRDAQDPDAAKKKLLDSFSSIGVRPKDLEQYLGHKTDALTPAELQDLRGIYRAIKDGESTWMDYVSEKQEIDKPKTNKKTYQPQSQSKPESKPKEETQHEEKVIQHLIDSFKNLHKKGLLEFEKEHRSEILTFPAKVFDEWCDKFKRTTGEDYPEWTRKSLEEKKEDAKTQNLGTVVCPTDGEHKPIMFCENARGKDKPCELYASKECLARWPE